ncbi:PAP-specific phosphatase HAL2-like isoform X2 [Cryptomeria japonica]|uniref:PAP-specific phosphatase HAL2-like isoform X2 n=2 Tax=Cryptomeria japonica TaxID=3369 RepID=UPI0027DA8373|nr:PAP-specific phosphatase HAL2-like isoform X2 [Cryptomeria japonica]
MVQTVVCSPSYKTGCFSRYTRTRIRNPIWCGTSESLVALELDMEGQAQNNGESSSGKTASELRTPTLDSAVGALKLGGKYDRELEIARRAVHLACALCQRVQDRLLKNEEKANTKNDSSFVTVADWSVQTVISWVLSQYFGEEHISMIAEEDTQALTGRDGNELLQGVVSTVNECLSEAVTFGLDSPLKSLGTLDVLNAINKGNSKGGPTGRHWVLDPVDGTLGFVRGDQYAVALAMIEDGEVVLGVLGCPNYPMRREWLNYHHRYYRLMSKLYPPGSGVWSKGCVISAQKGSGQAWMEPLVNDIIKLGLSTLARPVTVSSIDDPALATFCEPVEKENSSHSFTEGLAHSLGLRNHPLRVYSMAKYAAIARGDAEIFMKFARAGYKEKVWDHAAGVLIIQEAGGVVTDAGGSPLDFSKGIYLEGLDRGIIACCGPQIHEKIIAAVDASWNSSSL